MSEQTDTIITCLCGQEIELPGDIVSDEIDRLKAENKKLKEQNYCGSGDILCILYEETGVVCYQHLDSVYRKTEAETTAQLVELTAISDALGTREGHSSVRHIEALQVEVKLLTEALEAIVKHQLIVGGSLATYSATVKIAEKALKGE